MRAGLVQVTATDDPADNAAMIARALEDAADRGAQLACTPEVSNMISFNRDHQRAVLRPEGGDATLAAAREVAAKRGLWVSLGSLALLCGDAGDERFVNRSLLIDAAGEVVARYDKIHMFDVDLEGGESYRESAGFRPGDRAAVADTPWGRIGLSICYDMRFPALHRSLAEAGAEVILSPAAFTVPTGKAHWHVLLRARAIETGCFVLAAAQAGRHVPAHDPKGRERLTYGHSLAVGPWGEVLLDMEDVPGVAVAELDLAAVAKARGKVPSLANARAFTPPGG
ncbi:carbon-nitrogen hydrolase family protein [Rhodovulum sp. DZ06]|uniref:carbon-nitrogen hydrolase family protein n=1 Tax=Rhodovulum sp. DZ06 TaxID=3425126 RepID=UPI003D32ABB8